MDSILVPDRRLLCHLRGKRMRVGVRGYKYRVGPGIRVRDVDSPQHLARNQLYRCQRSRSSPTKKKNHVNPPHTKPVPYVGTRLTKRFLLPNHPPPNTGIVRSGHPYAIPCTTDSTSLTQCSFKLVAPEIRRERSQGRTLIGNLPKFPVPMSRPTRLRFPNKRTFWEAE